MKKLIFFVIVVMVVGFFILNFLNGLGRVEGKVTITHTDKTLWQIDYNFEQAVIGIMTGPETKEYHESSWNLPEGFHFVTDESGYSWLEKIDKGSFKSLTINVKTYDKLVLYAPQPFAVFDYGVSINTGPLGFATKVKLLGLIEMMHNFELKYSFVGLENEYILVPNSEKTEDVLINGQGYYVFFGEQDKIEENETVTLILDSDFPNELREDILSVAEKFVTFYNQELGEVLNDRLMIQLTYTHEPRVKGESFGIGGGAQSEQFMGIAMGPIDSAKIKETKQRVRAFMAHEMAHIWEKSIGNDNMRWFSEGGVEMLSHVGMKRLGFMTEKEFNTFLNKYVTESIEDLAKVSLELPHRQGFERLNYSGGTIALWAICKSISKKNEANDIYKLNRELHKFSEDSLSKFPKECLNATFASLGMNDDEILGIDYFINTKHENPQKAYVDLFELTGVEYEVYGDSLVIKEQK